MERTDDSQAMDGHAPEHNLLIQILWTYFEDIDNLARIKDLSDNEFKKTIWLKRRRATHPVYRLNTILHHLYSDVTDIYCSLLNIETSAFRGHVLDYIFKNLKVRVEPGGFLEGQGAKVFSDFDQ